MRVSAADWPRYGDKFRGLKPLVQELHQLWNRFDLLRVLMTVRARLTAVRDDGVGGSTVKAKLLQKNFYLGTTEKPRQMKLLSYRHHYSLGGLSCLRSFHFWLEALGLYLSASR